MSKSSVCFRPFFSTCTSAEKPGSATSASGTPSGAKGVATRGTAPASALGQLSRVTAPSSGISGSVTLSIRIVNRTESTGWSSITGGMAVTLAGELVRTGDVVAVEDVAVDALDVDPVEARFLQQLERLLLPPRGA